MEFRGVNQMKTNLKYQGGLKFIGFDEQEHETIFDADPLGGPTEGPTPVNMYLQALAACGAIDIVVVLKKRRKVIDNFEVEVESERRDTHPKIYTKIKIKYIISGEGITEKEMDRAVSLSEEKLCSVSNMIDRRSTKIDISYKIVR